MQDDRARALSLPGPDYIDRVLLDSDRPVAVLRNLQQMFDHGRLGGTGYLSILPVDQGIEHSAAASFAKNPAYFDPMKLAELAVAAECSAFATTLGVLGLIARRYAHKVPLILKLNHNELLTYPNRGDQVPFASVRQAVDLGAVGVGATIYFGSEESTRQLREVTEMFAEAHRYGLFTILWCYLRNPAFKTPEADYHLAADLTGQANHLGVTIEADIIKQKLPVNNGGYTALRFGRTDPLVYEQLTTDHPIDLTRWQVVNCYSGRIGLINSGGGVLGCRRPRRGGADRCHKQAGRGHGAHSRPQGLPAPDERGSRDHTCHPGRIPRRLGHRRLSTRRKRAGPRPRPATELEHCLEP